MPWGTYVQIRSQLQAASRTLPTSEQLQLGGESSVRGYPQGDYLADNGWDLNMEWYSPSYFIPPSWKISDISLRSAIEPFVFYDMGGGKLIVVNSGETREQFLSGVGAGFKIQIRKNMYLKAEWAVPTGDKPIHGTGPSTFDESFQAST
jgi:hemolysin activation/secretion protein